MPELILRSEMLDARLDLGGVTVSLADYATTGLKAVAIGPAGSGKTNAGLLMAEQLSRQGWVSVLIDPEQELSSLYGTTAGSPQELEEMLHARSHPVIVVNAVDAAGFVGYGKAILQAADTVRKPIFCLIDEGQLFSAPRRRQDGVGEASDIINDIVGRGRKRALDVFITALRYTGTLHRSIFSGKNLTLIGCQEDPTIWSSLAPQFRGTGIEFSDLNALAPGEFYCFSRRGLDKAAVPMAQALQGVAMRTLPRQRTLPATFRQWDAAMQAIPTDRLEKLTQPVVSLLASVAGLTSQQLAVGSQALLDELNLR